MELVLHQWGRLPPPLLFSCLPSTDHLRYTHTNTHAHTHTAEGKPVLAGQKEQVCGQADLNALPKPSHLYLVHRARELRKSACIFVWVEVKVKVRKHCWKWCPYAHVTEGTWSTRMSLNLRLNWENQPPAPFQPRASFNCLVPFSLRGWGLG